MIIIYKRMSEKKLRKYAKEIVQKCGKFFIANPKRRVCRVGAWYGKTITIRRNHVEEDVDKALEEVLKRDPAWLASANCALDPWSCFKLPQPDLEKPPEV